MVASEEGRLQVKDRRAKGMLEKHYAPGDLVILYD
jgi:hypothetical protein